jgi:spore coat protein U-like protein
MQPAVNGSKPGLPRLIAIILSTALALFLGVPAGGDASGFFTSAGACTVTAMPIVFGQYDPLRHQDFVTAGMLQYRCSGSPRRLTIGLTAGESGSFKRRRMGHGKDRIIYNLYLDAANTQVWGDGTGGSQAYSVNSPPPNTEVSIPVYGRVFGDQRASAGTYQDNISVVATY